MIRPLISMNGHSINCCPAISDAGTRAMLVLFSSRRRHTRCLSDWSSDVCSSDLNKKRQVLKVLAPIGQALSGKGTLEIEGAHSANVFSNAEQEFYIQLSEPERFGVARLTSKGNLRIVENLTYLPVDKDVEETPTLVETLQRELDPAGLYKIWPKDPLPEGEYAVIEYTVNEVNIQIWDFAIHPKPAGK